MNRFFFWHIKRWKCFQIAIKRTYKQWASERPNCLHLPRCRGRHRFVPVKKWWLFSETGDRRGSFFKPQIMGINVGNLPATYHDLPCRDGWNHSHKHGDDLENLGDGLWHWVTTLWFSTFFFRTLRGPCANLKGTGRWAQWLSELMWYDLLWGWDGYFFYVNGECSSLTTRYVDVKARVYKRMFHILEVIGTDKVQA